MPARENRNSGFFFRVLRALASLRLAVVVLLGLAASLATGTILESLYDTPTSQYWVYRSFWFHALLALLGVNIFCVAMTRLPWRKRHIPFLLAHLGILTLLTGSWMTEHFGVDGSLRINEGETSSVVELNDNSLFFTEKNMGRKLPIPWLPPDRPFQAIPLQKRGLPYELTIDQFISHAEPDTRFLANTDSHPLGSPKIPAIRLKLSGGPMGISQDLWLWAGDPSTRALQAGPAFFSLGKEDPSKGPTRLALNLIPEPDGSLRYRGLTSSGEEKKGSFPASHISGAVIDPDWKGLKVTLAEWIPDAVPLMNYRPSRTQYGTMAPPSAIHIVTGKDGIWLGLGDRAQLHMPQGTVDLAYLPERVILPFSIRLNHFEVLYNTGTQDPASYSSQVTVTDGKSETPVTISMNEPLQHAGITFYQASYEEAQPRPLTSILSVNRDPGRPWKYLGSLLIVLGTILLFVAKYRKKPERTA